MTFKFGFPLSWFLLNFLKIDVLNEHLANFLKCEWPKTVFHVYILQPFRTLFSVTRTPSLNSLFKLTILTLLPSEPSPHVHLTFLSLHLSFCDLVLVWVCLWLVWGILWAGTWFTSTVLHLKSAQHITGLQTIFIDYLNNIWSTWLVKTYYFYN